MNINKNIIITLIVISLTLSACWSELYVAHLSTALINESYSFQLAVDNDDLEWDLFDDSYYVYSLTGGRPPVGTYVTSSGAIVGTPAETGNFSFEVTMHDIDYESFGEDDVSSDSKWYTLFVTKRSTNTDCPAPNDEDTTDIYICSGLVEKETLAQNESFELDINFFVDYTRASAYAISEIDFTITYDSTLFAIDPVRLTSLLLKEAATRVDSTVLYDNTTAGQLKITITAHENTLHKSGRIIDIPFYALSDVPAGQSDFSILINHIQSDDDDVNWPEWYEIDGAITVSNDTTTETP
ncbi:MAG: hypothetical protein HQM16_18015 [Deltaproteobacteria bacterium]|nr:hypothetical protein [Deltaproteobacteria bacterium]